jgi:hypothetical protein
MILFTMIGLRAHCIGPAWHLNFLLGAPQPLPGLPRLRGSGLGFFWRRFSLGAGGFWRLLFDTSLACHASF